MTHWAATYVGRAWDGQDEHCWSFCRLVWAERFGLAVPEMPLEALDPRATRRILEAHPERVAWTEVVTPAEGDAVLMARGRRPCHVGIWIAPASVLHAIAGGSVCSPATRLSDLGYRIAGIYRRVA